MTTPRSYQTEAIVIRKTKLGEADTILTLYTPQLGKIQGFAKSLRKTRSKMAGHLELITHSTVTLARGRNLDTITGSQTIESFIGIKNDLWLTSCALYVLELVHQFTAENIENYPLFQLLQDTLQELSRGNNKELLLRYFELHLLEKVGYRPQLRECVSCHRPVGPVTNYFSIGAGGVLCPECPAPPSPAYPLSVNAQKVLRLLQNSDTAVIDRLKLDEGLEQELERAIAAYLKFLLEKDVKSADWLRNLKSQRLSLKSTALPPPEDSL
ncbi:MAG: DNA repair protein RecO [Chloroflexota bacterium]